MSKTVVDIAAVGLQRPSVKQVMLQVCWALIPGTVLYAYLVSSAVIVNVLLSCLIALCTEALCLYWRKRPLKPSLNDGSIVVAAMLLALAVPPSLPLWQLGIGAALMTMLGKHVYGGLGQNPFNPAMVGYAILLISFPQTMTLWLSSEAYSSLTLQEILLSKLQWDNSLLLSIERFDGITQATPLEHLRTQRLELETISAVTANDSHALFLSTPWMLIQAAYLSGGLYLLWRRIITWPIPVALIITLTLLQALYNASHSVTQLHTFYLLFSGATMLGAFFIATDPVTAASSHVGRLIYGAGIGALVFIIRQFGGYPEGMAFAILLMNLCSPLIDHLYQRFQPQP